jgi:hypothetical protein
VPPRRSWLLACCLFAFALGAYLANGRVLPSPGDDIPNRLIPFSLLQWGTPTLDPFRDQLLEASTNPLYLVPRRGHLLSLYSPATSVAALPVYLPCYLWLRARGHTDALYLFKASRLAGKLAAATIAATSVAIVFLLLLVRRVRPAVAAVMALAFSLATDMWAVSSQLLWQHGPGVLCILLGMACLVPLGDPRGEPLDDLREIPRGVAPDPATLSARRRRLLWRYAMAGFCLASAAAIRPQNALFLLAGAALCAWEAAGARERARRLGVFAAGSLAPLAAVTAYNEHYLGTLLGGYGVLATGDWFSPAVLPQGLAGLLLSPNRGLLWFTPIALVGVVGMALALRRWREEAWLACFSVAAVLYLLVHAAYSEWWGGGSFGPRYLTETLPVLTLASAVAVPRLTAAGRWLAVLLLAWSVVVEIDGAVCYPASRWGTRMSPEIAQRAWDLRHWIVLEDFQTWVARRQSAGPPPRAPLPPSAFRVEWLGMTWFPRDTPRPALRARMQARVLVRFRNTSDQSWPDAVAADPARSGHHAVRLAYRWRQRAAVPPPYGSRSDLREPLPPGGVTGLRMVVVAPPTPGDYVLQFDLVQEDVAWFEDRGAQRFVLPMRILPAAVP